MSEAFVTWTFFLCVPWAPFLPLVFVKNKSFSLALFVWAGVIFPFLNFSEWLIIPAYFVTLIVGVLVIERMKFSGTLTFKDAKLSVIVLYSWGILAPIMLVGFFKTRSVVLGFFGTGELLKLRSEGFEMFLVIYTLPLCFLFYVVHKLVMHFIEKVRLHN